MEDNGNLLLTILGSVVSILDRIYRSFGFPQD